MDDPKLVLERPDPIAAEPATSAPAYKKWQRNEDGLLQNVDYVFNEDGTVNWLAMIPKEYFVVNKQASAETDVSKVEDRNKLILLAGFKKVAQLRGFTNITTDVHQTSSNYVAMTTQIDWLPNYETSGEYVRSNGHADAHEGNVSTAKSPNGFVATNFLMTIAENRAFVRAVKNFLQISVLGQDEVKIGTDEPVHHGGTTTFEELNNGEARKNLQKVLENASLSFENFKNAMTKHVGAGLIKDIDVQLWESINDIPSEKLFEVTNFLQQRLRARATTQA